MPNIQPFIDAHPAEFQWLCESAPQFDFAHSVLRSLNRWGSLTPNQLATVQRLCVQSAERKAKAQAKAETAPTVEISAIGESLNRAFDAGLAHPKLRLDTFVFSRAPDTGKNAGAVYVKEDGAYLGKVVAGRLFTVLACDKATEERILAVSADPYNSALAYGKKYGKCSVCNRDLTLEESVNRAMGAVCAKRFGW